MNDLTLYEQEELESNEQVIETGGSWFIAVGMALQNIKQKRLYREFGTWEEYVITRWSHLFHSARHADRWIDAVGVQEQLDQIGLKIENEAQARQLKALPGELLLATAQLAADAAALEGVQITASHYHHAAQVLREMGHSEAVEDGDGGQIPATRMLAPSVVERRMESVQQRIEQKRAAAKWQLLGIVDIFDSTPDEIWAELMPLLGDGRGRACRIKVEAVKDEVTVVEGEARNRA